MLLAVLCLLAGMGGGWLIRGLQHPQAAAPAGQSSEAAPATQQADAAPAAPKQTPEQLKQLADSQAAPILAQLKSDPGNADLLTSVGNLYYDAQQYPTAADYYARALQSRPADVSVRTDMGTAYWYMGQTDRAIAEFKKALSYAPTNASTLFNLGLVQWKGKHDARSAIANWKKLLAANPNYAAKDKVEDMLSEVQTAQQAAR